MAPYRIDAKERKKRQIPASQSLPKVIHCLLLRVLSHLFLKILKIYRNNILSNANRRISQPRQNKTSLLFSRHTVTRRRS